MTPTARVSLPRGRAPAGVARRVRPASGAAAAAARRNTDSEIWANTNRHHRRTGRRNDAAGVAHRREGMRRVGNRQTAGEVRAVGFPGGGGPAVDPASPAGRLYALERAAPSPEEAIVFRKAANAVRVLCEARLQQATAMAVLGLAAGLTSAGVEAVQAKSGFAVTKNGDGDILSAAAHMWVEIDGRVVDVCYNTTYVFEDARRAGLDLSDEQLVRSKVGSRMSPLLEGILSGKRRLRLQVLDKEIDVGPEAWATDGGSSSRCIITEVAPPEGQLVGTEGLDEAKSMRRAFEDLIHNDEVNQFWLDGMPPEYRCIYADLGGPGLM